MGNISPCQSRKKQPHSSDKGPYFTRIGTITVNVGDPISAGQNQARITVLPNGQVALIFKGTPGQAYDIQRSPDLASWTPLSTATAAQDATLPFTDPAPLHPRSFYRIAVAAP